MKNYHQTSTFFFRPIRNDCKQIQARIRGIEIMNDDPSRVRVLYGKIESDAFQRIGDRILKRFIDAGQLMEGAIITAPSMNL